MDNKLSTDNKRFSLARSTFDFSAAPTNNELNALCGRASAYEATIPVPMDTHYGTIIDHAWSAWVEKNTWICQLQNNLAAIRRRDYSREM